MQYGFGEQSSTPFDVDQPTVLYTDWSKRGIGAILAQPGADGKERVVACISRSCNKHERNYSSYQGELLAVVWAVKTYVIIFMALNLLL